MNTDELLAELTRRHGIDHGYHDIWGTWHPLSSRTAVALLDALNVDTSSDEALGAALHEIDEKPWQEFVPPVVVNRDGEPCVALLNVDASLEHADVQWRIDCEDGRVLQGEQPCTHLEAFEERWIGERLVRRRRLFLHGEVPHGYHRVQVSLGEQRGSLTLIRTPSRCVGLGDARVWGVCLQLYGVRSAGNWGVGDFGDLRQAVRVLARCGADFVGLNPLHALYLDAPTHASPYSPSSRVHTNAMYLHIESMPDYRECAAAHALVESDTFQVQLAALRRSKLVDYAGVAGCKRPLFEQLFSHFRDCHLKLGDRMTARSTRGEAFMAFCEQRGAGLYRHALFEALHEHFSVPVEHGSNTGNAHPRAWPEEFDNADSAAVKQFGTAHANRIVYFQYLQWQCALQLQSCREEALQAGMRVGLYLDLAVGGDGDGADVWAAPACYAAKISVGAPADDFALQGQVWGLPPLRADRLREAAYEPFVRCLRANMREAGALRIDHVLGLLRLFWVPEGGVAVDGAYVHYPVDDLLAITALESERTHCLVVGEDLGTVPDAMREALARFAVLSYRVFYFEKHWHGDHSFRRPHDYPQNALVTLTTHDLPTLIGYWIGRDLEIRHALGLFSSEQFEAQQRETRALDRARILDVLRAEGLWPVRDGATPDDDALAAGATPPRALVEAIYRLLARSNSSLLSVQMEDALGEIDQVNVPGTVSEQPNWQRKLSLNLEQWSEHEGFAALCSAINAER